MLREIKVPQEVYEITISNFSKTIVDVHPGTTMEVVNDFLDQSKLPIQAKRMARYFSLEGKALEVGCGYGLTLAYLRQVDGVEAFGIEPTDSANFPGGLHASRLLLEANGLNPNIVIPAKG